MELILQLLFQAVLNVPIVRTFILTVIPSLLLLRYVRGKDRLEPEPPKLIWSLVGLGILSTTLAYVLEVAGLSLLVRAVEYKTVLFGVLHNVVVVGLAEEFCKYLMLRLRTWKNPEFNCLFDGLVYAVAVSAGFALAENVLYVFRYGASVVFIRAVVSIPAHICFAVFMGAWYAAAKKYEYRGNGLRKSRCLLLSVAVPALAHGGFDLIADHTDATAWMIVFALYVIAMFVLCWRLMKKLAEEDAYYTHGGAAL